jgi:hypothetical protein
MTLRDKIAQCPDKQGWTNPNYGRAENIEKIADDYALEFGEWLRIEAYDAGNNWVYLQDNQDYTTEELTKIFKKEKGL